MKKMVNTILATGIVAAFLQPPQRAELAGNGLHPRVRRDDRGDTQGRSGEFGCYAKMDHESCLKWMEAGFREWRRRGYGWAIWDYDGPFGFVDSGRPDAEYIEIDGRKIDRKMLELLRQK